MVTSTLPVFSICPTSIPHPAFQQGMVYTVIFKGLDNHPDLLELLQSTSELVTMEERPPPSLEGIKFRILSDLDRLKQVLQSQGYYECTIFPFIRAGNYARLIGKLQVILEISLGPRASIHHFLISSAAPLPSKIEDAFSLARDELLLPPAAAGASKIKGVELQLISILANNGYPLGTIHSSQYLFNPTTHLMDIKVNLAPGPLCYYGKVSIHGLKTLDPSYVSQSVPWEQGEDFSTKDVEKFRNTLRETNLFSSIEIKPEPPTDANLLSGPIELPISITTIEGPSHYIGAGLGYTTSEGMSGRAFWGNRNLWGGGEKLDVRSQWGNKKSFVDVGLRLPHYGAPKQDLFSSVEATKERTEAYQKRGVGTIVQLERKFNPQWTGKAGLSYEVSRISTTLQKKTYHLPGIPLTLRYSTVESLLNPTQGVTFDYAATPYPALLGGKTSFGKIFLQHLVHIPLDKYRKSIFSAYTNVGFMPHASRRSVPPDKLFYAGGGGSVRGYAPQMAGPLNAQNDPLGGISAFEAGVEMLHKISQNVALVSFVEGANVYDQVTPNFSRRLFWGVGAGIRYYTSFAPIRFDIAFPLHRRRKIDSPFQLYLGLGQAF